jgi:hypothetical protein
VSASLIPIIDDEAFAGLRDAQERSGEARSCSAPSAWRPPARCSRRPASKGGVDEAEHALERVVFEFALAQRTLRRIAADLAA